MEAKLMNSPNDPKPAGGREKVKGGGCLLVLYFLLMAIPLAILIYWVVSH
jgi:membrane protein insertase Oxa1/YidC/SpoIIIJ